MYTSFLQSRRKDSSEAEESVGRQFGIAGVDYDTIYLSIGVAATLLFIIETLYKAYTLFVNANSGRSIDNDFSDFSDFLAKVFGYTV